MIKKKDEVFIDWRIGPVRERPKSQIPLGNIGSRKEKESASMSLIMTTIQECPLEVAFKDSHNNPAAVENIVWSSSDENVLRVTADAAEPQKAMVTSVGTVGTGQVNVQADARVGDGTNEITGLLDVEVLAAEASIVEISAGTPVDTPESRRRRK